MTQTVERLTKAEVVEAINACAMREWDSLGDLLKVLRANGKETVATQLQMWSYSTSYTTNSVLVPAVRTLILEGDYFK